ncbi:MAG TPA: dTDP-4-dehydrorhamnose reductase [Candidatus Acidoferrum sp.]|nr:dTDP-4-dehydrorhamnose reductase [Candidatus Acidoferrum sp.]
MTIRMSDTTGKFSTNRTTMRVLVIGVTGLLGKVLLEEWDGDTITGVGSREVDIRDHSQLSQLFGRCRPEWTILLAAYTDVDGCERDPKRAHEVNCGGAMNVARAARDARSKLLFVSTDYVFDGSKDTPYEPQDAVCPINAYGRSKAEAEKGIREILPSCCILRTSWLFGAVGRCFPNTILELARNQKKLRVVADQIGSPTFSRDLARAIVKLVQADARGTVHASNAGECSWCDFARELVRAAGFEDVSVEAVRTEDVPRPARRPSYSVLSNTSLERYAFHMRPWQETLGDYFADRLRASNVPQQAAPKTAAAGPLRAKSGEVR